MNTWKITSQDQLWQMSKTGDVDVFSIVKEKDIAFVNYLMVRNGTIVQTQTNKVETHLDETQEEILSFCYCSVKRQLLTVMQQR